MHIDDFFFELPQPLIAQRPASRRSESRLMVVPRRGDAAPIHTTFDCLPEFLCAGDVLVLNRSRVVPARLSALRDDGLEVEVFFLRVLDAARFVAWARPLRKLRAGDVLRVGESAFLSYVERHGEREGIFSVAGINPDVMSFLEQFGHTPLPPYVRRPDHGDDRERYQTVYAREPGSVAAPTAGLHFDEESLARIAAAGVDVLTLVLHVGPGTFQPLDHPRLEDNRLHEEAFSIEAKTLAAIARARAEKRRVIAVGTTTTRALETAALRGWLDAPEDRTGHTDLFIRPGFEFRAVDGLVTNFHLPRSSLLVLVSAFSQCGDNSGRERILGWYTDAVARGYRFFSYGDAMLIV